MDRADRERVEPLHETRATISMTCVSDGRAHRVPDVEIATEVFRRDGYYQALCGHRVAAASMVEPDGRPCPLCTEMARIRV